jgi:glycine oxidase
MAKHADCLIIGGGVIGLTTAYYLSREGVRVEVLDQGAMGREASWAGAGILPPGNPQHARTPFDQLRAYSSTIYPGLSGELREETGIDNGYRRSGGIELVGPAEQAAVQEWRGEGIVFETLEPTALAKLEPALAPGLGHAFHLPDMAQVRNPRHVKALLAACARQGVRLRQGCPVLGWERKPGHITAARTAMGPVEADQFLITAGAWTGGLLDQIGWRAEIRPVRGQIALLQTTPGLVRRILLWGARYLVPRPDGRVLIGSTEEDAGFDKRTTAAAIAGLLTLASTLVPALADASLEQCWAGLRPGSPDGLPFLGRVPGWENLSVAAGHFRAGLQLSPATGLVMKELLLGQKTTISLEPFRLDRPPGPKHRPAFRS